MVLLAGAIIQDGQDNKFGQDGQIELRRFGLAFLGVVLPHCPFENFRATFSWVL